MLTFILKYFPIFTIGYILKVFGNADDSFLQDSYFNEICVK